MGLRSYLRKITGTAVDKEEHLNISYSQEGEDLVLGRIFENQRDGFFVDVGALHPTRYSNTYRFYKIGWRGINIDAMPGSMKLFNEVRPNDINIERPISDKAEMLDYYIFNEPALNTLSKSLAEERCLKDKYYIERVVNIATTTLTEVLDENLPKNIEIDFLTIDAEGLDYQVLKSNNWKIYSPKVVLIESEFTIKEMVESDIDKLLSENNYEIFAKTVKTYFYKVKSFNI